MRLSSTQFEVNKMMVRRSQTKSEGSSIMTGKCDGRVRRSTAQRSTKLYLREVEKRCEAELVATGGQLGSSRRKGRQHCGKMAGNEALLQRLMMSYKGHQYTKTKHVTSHKNTNPQLC